MKYMPWTAQLAGLRLNWFLLGCVLLAAAKLVLVSENELVSDPYDGNCYVGLAKLDSLFKKAPVGRCFPPVYPRWIALVHMTGLPLRIGSELAFLTAALAFASSLLRAGVKPAVGLAVFAATALHPASMSLFDWARADTLYAILMLFALASLVRMSLAERPGRRACHALAAGVFLALLWNTRPEHVDVAALVVLAAGSNLMIGWYRRECRREVWRRLLIAGALPACMLLVGDLGFRAVYYAKTGVFASFDRDAPGYKAAYHALQRIKPPRTIKYVPVTTEARAMGYAESPTFKELQPVLERPSNPYFAHTKYWMGVDGEIGGAFFVWNLYATSLTNAKFRQMAREINCAIDEGRLPGRWAPFTFLDPDFRSWVPALPASFMRVSEMFYRTYLPLADCQHPAVADDTAALFDEVGNRRAALAGTGPVRGWAAVSGDGLSSIELRTPDDEVLSVTRQLKACPDLTARFPSLTPGQACSAFELPRTRFRFPLDQAKLIAVTSDRTEVPLPWDGVTLGQLRSAADPKTGKVVHFAIEAVANPHRARESRTVLKAGIAKLHVPLLWALTGGAGLALLIVLVLRRGSPVVSLLLVNLALIVLLRVALFVLVDASAYPVDQIPRYLLPVMPLYTTFLILLVYQGWQAVASRMGFGNGPPKLPGHETNADGALDADLLHRIDGATGKGTGLI